MSHVSQNLAALVGGAVGLTDPLLYHVISTQASMTLTPGDGVIVVRAANAVALTLPSSRTCQGRAFLIINATRVQITVLTQDPHDTINGQRSVPLNAQYTGLLVLSDGQGWWGLKLTVP